MVRGGKLKERDPLFELVLKWITTAEVRPSPPALHHAANRLAKGDWVGGNQRTLQTCALDCCIRAELCLSPDPPQWDMTLTLREAMSKCEHLISQVWPPFSPSIGLESLFPRLPPHNQAHPPLCPMSICCGMTLKRRIMLPQSTETGPWIYAQTPCAPIPCLTPPRPSPRLL